MSETTLIKEWVDECEKKGKKQSKSEEVKARLITSTSLHVSNSLHAT